MKQKNTNIIFRDKAVFFHKVDQTLLKKKQIKQKLKQSTWNITNNTYHRQHWRKLFIQMKQSKVESLKLDQNQHSQIIKNIQNVCFTDLKSLILSNNKIDNIQNICFINCERIEFLGLSNNNIRSVTCLHKLSKPFLQFISINANPILQIDKLSQIYLSKNGWFTLYLDYEQKENPVSEDLSIVHKFDFAIPDRIYMLGMKRIQQSKLKQLRRFNLVSFFMYM